MVSPHARDSLIIGHGGLSVEDVFAEGTGPHWLSSIYARILLASSPPQIGVENERLDRAFHHREFHGARADLIELDMGAGNPAPSIVFVGERLTRDAPYPFYSRTGKWLWKALRLHGWDELSCYVANSCDNEGNRQQEKVLALYDAFKPYNPVWVTLGRVAAQILNGLKIKAFNPAHPLQHHRYKHREGPEGYVRVLKDAGVPEGPGVKETYQVEGRTNLADLFDVKEDAAYRPKPSKLDKKVRSVSVAAKRIEEARRLYVSGKIDTVKGVAKETGIHYDALLEASRVEGWKEERDRYIVAEREKHYEDTINAETRAAGQARKLAWAISTRGLASILEGMQSGSVKLSASEVKQVATIAMALSDRGDPAVDDELAKLRGLSLTDLRIKVENTISNQWGTGKSISGNGNGNGSSNGKG